MNIKHFTILLLSIISTVASAQVKVVDIPEVPQKNGIRFDRFGSSKYFACYTSGKSSFVSFYDADLKALTKYSFPTEPVNISSPIYASSDDLLCLAFYRYAGKSGMEATLYTFNNKGELQGTKELKGSTIIDIVVHNDNVAVIENNLIKETLTILYFDHSLNQTWFKSIPFPESDLDEVRGFIPGDDALLITVAYTQNDGSKAVKIFGLNMNDGNQFLTYSKRSEEQFYYFNSCGKSGDNYYFIGENASSSVLSGNGMAGSGIFKLVINNKGERVDFTAKTWMMLIPEMQGTMGRTHIFSSISGSTFSIGLDKAIKQNDGFILVCHDHDKFRAVYTDASLTVKKTIDLRQLESDKGEFMYEYTFCENSGGNTGMIYMTDNVDGVAAIFTHDLSESPKAGKEVIKIDGSNNGPVFNSTSEELQRGFTNNLPTTNPSIISSSCDRIILFEDYSAEKDAARIYLYSVK